MRQRVVHCPVIEMPSGPFHIILILPAGHDHVAGHHLQRLRIIFEHIVPDNHSLAQLFSDNLMNCQQVFSENIGTGLAVLQSCPAEFAAAHIPVFVAAGMKIRRRKYCADFSEVILQKFCGSRLRRAERPESFIAEAAIIIAAYFRQSGQGRISEEPADVAQRGNDRDDVNISSSGVNYNLSHLFSSVTFIVRRVWK